MASGQLPAVHHRSTPLVLLLLLVVALAVFSAACIPGLTPGSSTQWSGTLLISHDGGVSVLRPDGMQKLLGPTGRTFAQGAVFDRDGSIIVALTTIGPSGGNAPSEGALQRIPPGQTKPQPFLKAGREGEIFVNPVWLGDRLVVASTYPIMRDGRYVDQGNEIVAIDPASGQRTVLAESAIEPAPSADGRWLAYTTIDPRTYEQSLALLEVGTGRTRVVVDERSGLRTLRAPALSPDGSSLAFAAWGNLVEGPRRGSWWNPFDPPVASAHGIPEDLYLLNINEGTFRKLTTAPKDDPTPAFSPDGSKLAVLSADGVYLMPVAGGQLSQISGSGGVGSIVWAP